MKVRRWSAFLLPFLLLTLVGPIRGEERREESPAEPRFAPPGQAVPSSLDTVRELIRQDRYEEAEGMARDLLQTTESTTGCESVEAADVIEQLVAALMHRGKAGAAETLELADRAISVRERALGPDDAGLSWSLALKAELLHRVGKPSEARPLIERSLSLADRALGPDAVLVGRIHSKIGAILRRTDTDASESHRREALRIFELAGLSDGRDAADALGGLGACAHSRSRYAEAEELYLRALRIFEKVNGTRSYSVAMLQNNLGCLANDTGDFERARGHLELARSIQEELLGPRHPTLVGTLLNLAITDASLGLPPAAQWEHVIQMADDTVGPSHPDAAQARANYGIDLKEIDIAKARRLWEQALAVLTKSYEATNPIVLWALELVAEGDLLVGDLDSAEGHIQRALTALEKRPESGPRFFAVALETLGRCRAEEGQIAEARLLFERSLRLLEKTLGADHPVLAGRLCSFGEFLHRHGMIDAADSALARALEVTERAYGEVHYYVAEPLFALADLRFEEGRVQEARSLFKRAVDIQRKTTAPDDPRNADGLRKYASFLLRSGDASAALDVALRVESISRRHLRSTVASLSERNALSVVARTPAGLDLAISAAAALREPASAKAALDALIRSRALVLDEMGERHRAFRVARDPDSRRLFDSYVAARTRLANLTARGEDEKSPVRYRKRLAEARAAKDAAERALAEKSAIFRRSQTKSEAGLGEVGRALPAGAALVAFARYSRYAESVASRMANDASPAVDSYAAFVLRHGSAAPVLVSLGPASIVDAQVALVRKSFAQAATAPGSPEGAGSFAEASCRRASAALKDLIWTPLEPHLGSVGSVFLVPEGSLQLVSFAALPSGTDGYLVESGPVLHTLSAERDLIPTPTPPGTGLMAAGAPAFDELPSDLPERPTGTQTARPALTVASAVYRGALPSCLGLHSLRFESLPSARLEIEDVAVAWKTMTKRLRGAASLKRSEADTLILSGPAASETAVKTSAPGRRIVHLATHGFFLGSCPSAPRSDAARPTRSSSVFAENPLLLSGLALAGANQRGSTSPGGEDGILTAEEIAALDLSGVEWAVLSACDTGVGELRTGEGLFGLRRAFQIAGARSVILSLWPVEDEASRKWMQMLYRNRIARGMTTAKAVHEASREALRKRRAAGLSTHPFYWAGFVAVGDWR